jgi:hypothetical protein
MNACVWRVNLVAVMLLVWTYAVAEAIAHLIPVWVLMLRDLTAHLIQQWFLPLEAYAVAYEILRLLHYYRFTVRTKIAYFRAVE